MTTIITATLIKTEFGSSLATADLEVIIDSAIDTVNSDAGTSIGHLTAGTITVTGDQAAAIKPLIAMKLTSRGINGASSSSFGLSGLSISQSISSSQNDVNSELYDRAINRLKEPPITIGKDTTGLDSE